MWVVLLVDPGTPARWIQSAPESHIQYLQQYLSCPVLIVIIVDAQILLLCATSLTGHHQLLALIHSLAIIIGHHLLQLDIIIIIIIDHHQL